MNTIILLLGLLSSYLAPSSLVEPAPAASAEAAPSAVLAFEHMFSQTSGSLENLHSLDNLDSLAGIPLFATKEELLVLKGQPLDIVRDPMQECLEYQYADGYAGVCGERVLYVHINPAQAREYGVRLNGINLVPGSGNLQDLLGAPDYVAEDGDVYLRGSHALKIYRDMNTGEWAGIDLFDGNSF